MLPPSIPRRGNMDQSTHYGVLNFRITNILHKTYRVMQHSTSLLQQKEQLNQQESLGIVGLHCTSSHGAK